MARTQYLDRAKPAFLDSTDAPQIRNMQPSIAPQKNPLNSRRVSFAPTTEVIP
ncbi:hypothetical protein T06_10361 [Trichinella sp. T6]|nr:hypothetical protein T06_10361 [Trichinella sp. T6]